jgi:hypothetical protein
MSLKKLWVTLLLPTNQLRCGMAPFCFLHSVLAILGWPLQGTLALSVLLSLDVCHIMLHTHLHTHNEVNWQCSLIVPLMRNLVMALWWNETQFKEILLHWVVGTFGACVLDVCFSMWEIKSWHYQTRNVQSTVCCYNLYNTTLLTTFSMVLIKMWVGCWENVWNMWKCTFVGSLLCPRDTINVERW